jgi:glycoside/pentoside/hexuronide:cation symporter, GPH family
VSESKHYSTAPGDRISLYQKIAYGFGSLVNNLLGAAISMMSIVLVLGLGMNPALVGTLMALPRLTDALTDPLMGYISDNTKSRWGRRRPYIFFGAIFAGILFAGLWQLPPGHSEQFYFWFFLIGSILFYLAYTMFATPWVALGYELTPDYHERTRVLGVANAMGQVVWIALPWFYAFMENDRFFPTAVDGARSLAIMIGVFVILVGVLPAFLTRERLSDMVGTDSTSGESQKGPSGLVSHASEFGKGLLKTIKSKSFVLLCAATFLVFNGYQLVASFTSYVLIYYVFDGDRDLGANLMGVFGTVMALSTFTVILLVSWVATKLGKKKTFFISVGISLFGYGLKWFCYSPEHPYLILVCAPFIAFGLGCLFTLMGSMIADVCDVDELETGKRREGMFGSIFWWVVKLGMAFVLLLSGFALNATGFDVALEGNQSERTLFLMRLFDVGVPLVTSALAIWVVYLYPISETKAHEVRAELEQRRGQV